MASDVQPAAIRVVEAILVLLMVVVALLGVARPLLGNGGLDLVDGQFFGSVPSIDVTLKPSINLDPAPPSLGADPITAGQGGEVGGPLRAKVYLWGPSWRQRLGVSGAEVLAGLVALGVLWIIWLIVRSLQQGDPFRTRNVRLLVMMAALVGIGGEAVTGLSTWGRLSVLSQPKVAAYVVIDAGVSFLPLLAMVGILIGAEIFRRGGKLRADVEGLV